MVPFYPPDRLHVVDRQFGGRSAPLFTSSSRALDAVLAGAENRAEKLARLHSLLPEECGKLVAKSILSLTTENQTLYMSPLLEAEQFGLTLEAELEGLVWSILRTNSGWDVDLRFDPQCSRWTAPLVNMHRKSIFDHSDDLSPAFSTLEGVFDYVNEIRN